MIRQHGVRGKSAPVAVVLLLTAGLFGKGRCHSDELESEAPDREQYCQPGSEVDVWPSSDGDPVR